MSKAFSPADLQSVPGRLLCCSVGRHARVETRELVAAVAKAFLTAQATADPAVQRRLAQLERWDRRPVEQRQRAETRVATMLSSGWSVHMLDPAAVAGTTRHHVGSMVGPFDLSRCTRFAEPWFTKPAQAFWTCPLPPGRGPTGFDTQAGELDPNRSYSSYLLDFSAEERIFVVDTLNDWQRLLELCGSDPSRAQPAPDYTSLPHGWAAVHVTSRALLRFEAAHYRDPTQVSLADWALESTAWLQPSRPPRISRIPEPTPSETFPLPLE